MLKQYIITLIVFLVIDGLWLYFVAQNMFKAEIGSLMGEPRIIYALIFYLLYPLAIVIFVLAPSIEAKSLTKAILLGAFLGLIAYGTYELTNMSTLKDWTLKLVIVDLLWGSFVTALSASISYYFNSDT